MTLAKHHFEEDMPILCGFNQNIVFTTMRHLNKLASLLSYLPVDRASSSLLG